MFLQFLFLLPPPTLNLNEGLLLHLALGVFGIIKPSVVGFRFSLYILAGDGERHDDDAAIPAPTIDVIPRFGVPPPPPLAPGGNEGGGIMEAEDAKWVRPPLMLNRELLGLSKLG